MISVTQLNPQEVRDIGRCLRLLTHLCECMEAKEQPHYSVVNEAAIWRALSHGLAKDLEPSL